MPTPLPLKRYKGPREFDAILIGTGIGSLTAGYFLLKKGKRVLFLEQHYALGGFTHVFTRPGFEWDVGLHYVGEVHHPASPTAKLFKLLSGGKLEWAPIPGIYDRFIYPDLEIGLEAGTKNFRNAWLEKFPGEAPAIDQYLQLIKTIPRKYSMGYHAAKALPGLVGSLLGPLMRRKFLKYSDQTTGEVLSGISANKKLVAALVSQWGDYGLPPGQSSFVIHCMVANHYLNGAAYPVGGSGAIPDTICANLAEMGAVFLNRAPVKEILVKKGRARGVLMEDGSEFQAPIVVSGAGIANTFNRLLKNGAPGREKTLAALDKVGASASHFCLYLGLDCPHNDLKVPPSNLWIYPGYDHDRQVEAFASDPEAEFPVVYISFPSGKDPKWEQNYPGKSTIEIITLAPYDWFRKWEGTRWMKRGEAYEELKSKFQQRLLEVLYRHVPAAKGRIVHAELSTPLSTRHFAGYEQGEIYGLAHNPERFRTRELSPFTQVKGLYLTGQDVVTAGIAGGMFGGVLCASAIQKRNVLADLKKV